MTSGIHSTNTYMYLPNMRYLNLTIFLNSKNSFSLRLGVLKSIIQAKKCTKSKIEIDIGTNR